MSPGLVLVGAALVTATASEDGPTLCPFALMTGVACPLCGMTRAAAHLVRGDVASAASSHPLVFLLTLALVVYVAAALTGRVDWKPRYTGPALITAAGLFLAVWLVRVMTGELPPV